MLKKVIEIFSLSWLVCIAPLYGQANIAVLPLDAKGVSEMEASVLTERLSLELFRTGQVTVLERGKMEEILAEQDFSLTGCVSEDCLIEVGQLLGVQQLVAGSVSKIGDTYSVALRLISAETGALMRVASYDHRGVIDDLLSLGMKAVAKDLAGINSVPIAPIEPAANLSLNFVPTTNTQYYRWQLRAGSDGYGEVILASIHSKRTLKIESIGINAALTAGTVEGFPYIVSEFHFLFPKSSFSRSAFIGAGIVGSDLTLTFGASIGLKMAFVEFRMISEGFGEIWPSASLGVRL